MIRVTEAEKRQLIGDMYMRSQRLHRRRDVLKARLQIAEGSAELARIRFWDVAESAVPELKTDGQGYRWSHKEGAFVRGYDPLEDSPS